MHRLNYDHIAHLYDEPLRDHAVDAHLVVFVETRAEAVPRMHVLDIGCGTGNLI